MNVDGGKGLHPFFTKPRDRKQTPPHESTDVEKENDRQASAAAPDLNGHEQTAIDTLISNVTAEEKSTPSTPGSRKRRKLNSSRASTPNVANHSSPPSENRRHHTRSVRQSEEGPLATADARIQTRPSTPQESETLKLNGKGGFKTPEKAKKDVRHDHEHVEQTRSPKRRGRPPKRKSFVVCLRYDFDGTEKGKLAIGEKIDSILASPLSRPKERTPEIRVPLLAHATNPSKPTHPFFSGKPAPRKEVPRNDAGDEQREEPKPARIKSFTTPVKMRHPGPAADSLTTRPDFTSFVSSKRPTLLGTKEAMWPPRDFQHHRHSPDPDYISLPHSIHSRVLKQKGKRFELGVDETITTHFTRLLKSTGAWHGRASDTNAIDLPLRSVESGRHLQRRIEDRLAGVKLHPAAINLQNKVGKTLSAFDRAECETQAWTTKYQPRCAQHVLQSEREMSALRSWLASLTVDAVRGGSSSDAKSGPSKGDEKPKRKRRKMKNGELDDFIVDGDDDGELAAFSQDELAPSGDTQSVIRELASFSSNGKKMNAVLISGTSGCGKTAAVHAVARELGYEVFEINSSSRRSGKDMLDRVGDMTLNHQVQHGQQGSFAPSATEAELPPPKNSLGAFFKAGHSAIVPKKRTKGKKEPEKAPSKKQRQALVLLEEVDILFDDDKQFWETVQTLATNSRRPIIMTCTDESQIPLEDLSLYAILRFRPPSVDLAAPYLLAMSAAEGHVLKLDDVAGLFREKHEDLRASINELQLYCQMAVGDTKGGLDWSLERWPPGVDKDASGEILHVVSNGTYRTAVGAPRGGTTSEILAEGWAKHQVEPLFLAEKMGLEGMEKDARPQMAKLAATSAFLDDLSTADALGSVDLPSGQTEHDLLDATLPPVRERDLHDYTAGRQVLDGDVRRDYPQISADLRVTVATLASGLLEVKLGVQSCMRAAGIEGASDANASARTARANMDRAANALGPLVDDSRVLFSSLLALDVAPYARAIAAYDLALEAHRGALAETESSPAAAAIAAIKHQRRTRASRSALEGGQRSSTRRDRWFSSSEASCTQILETAGIGWPRDEGAYLAAQRSQISSLSAPSEPQSPSEEAATSATTVTDSTSPSKAP